MLRAVIAFVVLSITAVLAFALAVGFGEQSISLATALSDPQSTDAAIFFSLRVPRALLAAMVGAALAASGSALQALMRNPLADPFILGVSGGAALGASLSIALGIGVVADALSGSAAIFSHLSGPSFFAFLGAMGATAIVFFAGRVAGRTSPYAVLLSGVIFNAFALAAVTLVRTLASPDRMGEIMFWLTGTLGYERPSTLLATFGLEVVALGGLFALAGRLNVLTLGDEDAQALGVPVQKTRLLVLAFSSLAIAGAVAVSGLIGFVGLIVPHLLRLVVGPDQRLLIPCSIAGGAALLLLADLGARLLFNVFHSEPPVGVLTALLGGPFFLLLLHRRRIGAER